MIYLDNSATTNHKPICVKMQVLKSMTKKYCSNPHRSGNKLNNFLASIILETREKLAKFVNSESLENVIFTSGATEALNLAILGTAKTGGHVITTAYEHNATLRPLTELKNKGIIELTIIDPEQDGSLNFEKFKNAIKQNTYLITCIHTSNVTGYTNNLEKLGKLCKEKNILFLSDCAQSAGHEKIDMKKNNIDMLAIAGHKGFYALTGVGALVISEKARKILKPIKFGGTGTHSDSTTQPKDFPEGYESGTCNTTGILSLNKGIDFINKNQEKINKKVSNLTKILLDELKQIEGLKFYPSNNVNSGIVSFNIKDYSSNDVSNYLNANYDICIRSGLHCAPLVHKHFKTLNTGMIRVSISYFNTQKDILTFVKAVKNFVCKTFAN